MISLRLVWFVAGATALGLVSIRATASAKTYCMQSSSGDGYASLRAAPKGDAPRVGKLEGKTKLPKIGQASGPGCASGWAKLQLASKRFVWACKGVLRCGTREQLSGASSGGGAGGGHPITEVVTADKVRLNVPYYYQYANKNDPSGTCSLTSAAMAIRFRGKRATPDGIYTDSRGYRRGVKGPVFDAASLAKIGKQYGLKHSQALLGVREKTVKTWLRRRVPFILQGYFSNWQVGHILLITGYDKTGWFIHDPAGRWNGKTGHHPYSGQDWKEQGKSVHYTYQQVSKNSLAGPGKYTGAILY